MEVHISLSGRGDLADRIYRQLRDAILDGRLRSGERLPPSRELARRLAVSRNTVSVAYDRLTADGFLIGRVGAGTFVGSAPVAQASSRAAPRGSVRPRRLWQSLAEVDDGRGPVPTFNFQVGVPDVGLFPLETWRRLVARELRPSALRSADHYDPAGHPG